VAPKIWERKILCKKKWKKIFQQQKHTAHSIVLYVVYKAVSKTVAAEISKQPLCQLPGTFQQVVFQFNRKGHKVFT
jgi:hypothetical protein